MTEPRTQPGHYALLAVGEEQRLGGIVLFCPETAYLKVKVSKRELKGVLAALLDYAKNIIEKKDYICAVRNDFYNLNRIFDSPYVELVRFKDIIVDCDPDVYIQELYREHINPKHRIPGENPGLFNELLS